ncbi:hypothetical protein AMS68_003146 [Peltaster fructicola]|uniref:DUF7357 domain-containing protein n=1 Tax=Peltaster fructicola TaxID=286661 RepID=A0A6H0XSN1_9PEZI|nr:hypothetical protein AMS68_003146 [Peltaster fructicola]
MRLYLCIDRSGLAPVKTVWPLSQQRHICSVAELLQDVNKTFPLETPDRTLLEYVVTLGGYECMRHHEVTSICKEDDELVIRPLNRVELDARFDSRRWLYDAHDQLVVDGIPLVESAGSHPHCSHVPMPPNKRRRLNGSESSQYELINRSEEQDDAELSSGEAHSRPAQRIQASLACAGHIKEADHNALRSGPSSETSSDSSSGVSSDSEDDSEESSSDSSVGRSSVNDGEAHEATIGFHAPTAAQPHIGQDTAEGHSQTEPSSISTSKVTTANGIPFQGLQRTRSRNIRRREKRRLEYLQAQGALGPQATFTDLHRYDQARLGAEVTDLQEVTRKRDNDPKQQGTTDIMARKQRLLNAIASGGVDVDQSFDIVPDDLEDDNDDGPPEQLSSKPDHTDQPTEQLEAAVPANSIAAVTNTATMMVPPSVERRRARLDVGGSARLLFGSLGVRAPRTDADKVKTREKLAARGTPSVAANSKPAASVQTDPVLTAAEYEDWQSRINLSAVECSDKDISLSAPPFPFKQRWDVQYRKPNKRRRDAHQAVQHVESYDKYNASGNDVLNYDDVDVDEEYDEEHWAEGALLNGDDGSYVDEDEQEDTFPPLPEQIESLPLLIEGNAAAGDYVVHTELVCSAATQWQPRWIPRTIQLIEQTARGWEVKLASRDLPQRRYDEDGNRVYDKFDMQDSGDEDEIETVREVIWNELTAPRLLLRT